MTFHTITVDGSYAITSGSDKKIKLWNPETGLLLKMYGGHADEVMDAIGSCDSCHIISASLDRSIIYWDVTTGQTVRRLRAHAGGVKCVAFSEDSNVVVSGILRQIFYVLTNFVKSMFSHYRHLGAKDNLVMCWDIRTRKLEPIQTLNDAKDCITRIIVNEFEIIVSSLDGCIRRYDLRKGEMICDNLGEPVVYMAQTKDTKCTLASCSDNVLRLLDNESAETLATYRGHRADDFQIECGILSNDTQIICGSAVGAAFIWDLVDEKIIGRLAIGSGVIQSLSTHPTTDNILFANKREFQMWGSST